MAPFDPQAPLTVATDASNTGLGGVLLQHGRPVMFVARSLSPAETRYAAIEKELLAVRFVLERCHFYTYGRPVLLQTDHKPLLGLYESELDRISLRMRRMLERLFVYDLEWQYVPGSSNTVADFLSRMAPEPSTVSVDDAEAEMLSRADAKMLSLFLSSHPFYRQVAADTNRDTTLAAVRRALTTSWPSHARGDVAPYWPVRHQLRCLGPYVMYQDRICVPVHLRPAALRLLHEGHPGVSFMQSRARNLFFWPKITRDVYDHVQTCVPCARTASARPREPLLPPPTPTGPGDQLAADFCSFQAKSYLILYDIFSHFPFCLPVTSESARELLRCCRLVFLQTGLPTIFASDNGGAFASQEFQAFLASCGTTHRASSPRYPQSNGAAERAVQTVKKLMARCKDETEFFRALLLLQNTRHPDSGVSPAEIFFGRLQRTPITPRPQQSTRAWSEQRQLLQQQRATQAKYYNRCTRMFDVDLSGSLALLKDFVGPVVTVHVLSPAPAPRAYYIRLPSGVVTIRNQRFLRPLPRLHGPPPPPRATPPVPAPAPGLPLPRTPVRSENAWFGLNALSPPSMTPSRVFPPSRTYDRSSTTPLRSSSTTGSPAWRPPSAVTGSTSSSVPGSPGDAHSASPATPYASLSPATPPESRAGPVEPASPVTVQQRPLGCTRAGRNVFPSLRARESQATGCWNPRSIVSRTMPTPPPPPQLPPLPSTSDAQ